MHRLRNRPGRVDALEGIVARDDKVHPLARLIVEIDGLRLGCEQRRVAAVQGQLLQTRLPPVEIHGRVAQNPFVNQGVRVAGVGPALQPYLEVFAGLHVVHPSTNLHWHDWYQLVWPWISTSVLEVGSRGRVGIAFVLGVVPHDAYAVVQYVGLVAVLCVDPEVGTVLEARIGLDNDFVPLAYGGMRRVHTLGAVCKAWGGREKPYLYQC